MVGYTAKMEEIEQRYKNSTGLPSRAWYKIYYGPLFETPFAVLGYNPGSSPQQVRENGLTSTNSDHRHAASTGYYENGEHDLLDCEWPDNKIVELLEDFMDNGRDDIRYKVFKSNIIFRRSPKKNKLKEIHGLSYEQAKDESRPYLLELLNLVRPSCIILAGPDADEFVQDYCRDHEDIVKTKKDKNTNQTILNIKSGIVKTTDPLSAYIVKVPSPGQWGWMYKKYNIAQRILDNVALR